MPTYKSRVRICGTGCLLLHYCQHAGQYVYHQVHVIHLQTRLDYRKQPHQMKVAACSQAKSRPRIHAHVLHYSQYAGQHISVTHEVQVFSTIVAVTPITSLADKTELQSAVHMPNPETFALLKRSHTHILVLQERVKHEPVRYQQSHPPGACRPLKWRLD